MWEIIRGAGNPGGLLLRATSHRLALLRGSLLLDCFRKEALYVKTVIYKLSSSSTKCYIYIYIICDRYILLSLQVHLVGCSESFVSIIHFLCLLRAT